MHLIGKVRLFIDLYSSGKSCLECYQIAGLPAELYPDQMNRLAQIAVFVRISLCLQLRHCRPFRCQFHHFELEEIRSVVETNRHVQNAHRYHCLPQPCRIPPMRSRSRTRWRNSLRSSLCHCLCATDRGCWQRTP